jgi:hypothetical protein
MGLGVASANALEPYGTWVGALGFTVLAATIVAQARRIAEPDSTRAPTSAPAISAKPGTMKMARR